MRKSRPKNQKIVPEEYDLSSFKPLKHYEDLYLINKKGTVISLIRREPHFMRIFPNKHGYLVTSITERVGKRCQKSLGFLIYSTFGPPRPSKQHRVRYIDGDKTNLSMSNMEWESVTDMMYRLNVDNDRFNGTSRKPRKKLILIYPDGHIEQHEGINYVRDYLHKAVAFNIDTFKARRDGVLVFSPTGFEKYKIITNQNIQL